MKHLNKFLALMLTFALCLCSSGLTAFAADTTDDEIPVTLEEVDVYEDTDSSEIVPLADSSAIIYQFSTDSWSPMMGAYGGKGKAQASGTLRFAIAAACRNPDGVHSNDQLTVKITSGLVTLATITVPVDGKLHVYRFNGSDYKKVTIVKGNNYTTKIEGPSRCLLMVISGYTGVE